MFWDKLKTYPKPLRTSILEGSFAALMYGGAMVFIIPFAVFLGANSIEIGLLTAIPALLSAWIQLGSMKLLSIYHKKRSIISYSVFFQAISWLLIALIPFFFPQNQIFWLIVLTTIGTTLGALGTPLWQSWMRSLTPKQILGEYFGTRDAITGIIIFLTTLACGFALELIKPSLTLYVFIGIFVISFFGRVVSTILFTKIEEPEQAIEKEKVHLLAFIRQLRKNDFGQFVLFGSLMTFTMAMIGPFFSFYLLSTLGLQSNYLLYTAIISMFTISSVISMPYWGKIIDKFGVITVLKASTLLLAIYPLGVILIRDPVMLIPLELMDGIISAGMTLGLANYIYEAFDTEKIIKYASYQSVLFGTATFFGTIITGYMLLFHVSWPILTNTFYIVCALVTALRIAIYASAMHKIKEPSMTGEIKSEKLVISALTLRPVTEPLISSVVPIISTAENITIRGVKRVENLALKELTLAERAAISEVEKIEEIAKKEVKIIRGRAIRKGKKKTAEKK